MRTHEWRLAGEALIQQRPQRVHIGSRAGVADLASGLLRSHVRRRPHDRSRLTDVARLGVDALGQTEIRDLGRAVGCQQDISRFQIAMDHPAQVGVMHGPGQGLDQFGGFTR